MEKLIAEFQLPETRLDLEPVLNTPRALPAEMAGRISIQTKAGAFGELEAKEALRRFIERASGALFPNHTNGPAQGSVGLKTSRWSLSRTTAILSRGLPPGQLPVPHLRRLRRFETRRWHGTLLQLNDRTRAEIAPQSLVDKMVGREFGYTNMAGQPLSYKIASSSEVSVKDLVVYPKQEGNRITIHLAYPSKSDRGRRGLFTWTRLPARRSM